MALNPERDRRSRLAGVPSYDANVHSGADESIVLIAAAHRIRRSKRLSLASDWAASVAIPYYRLDVKSGSWTDKIASITVGPCPHPETSRMAITGLLVKELVTTDAFRASLVPGIVSTHPPVSVSKIPYRSW